MPVVVCRLIELCVFRFSDNRAEYLLLKRSRSDNLYPGIWQFVTGTIKEGERALDAALREMEEETRIRPKRFWTVPFSSTFYDPVDDTMNISPFFAAQAGPRDEPVLSSEHESYEWVSIDRARPLLVWPSQRNGLEIVDQYVVRGEHASHVTIVPLPC